MQRYKFPRIPHISFSESIASDDLISSPIDFEDWDEIVVTEKMDGENTSIYSDNYVHARSIDSSNHPSRDYVKRLASTVAYRLPRGWRICGENLYAKHSIKYSNLQSYFYGFAVFDEDNVCLDFDESLKWFEELGIPSPKILYRGEFDFGALKTLSDSLDTEICEGFIVRKTSAINYSDFSSCVLKFVRSGHVQTDDHWLSQQIIKNTISS